MISFPTPLDGELISGLIGRAVAYYGSLNIINGLLKTHINGLLCDGRDIVIVGKILSTSGYTIEDLFFNHTLYPIWLPFIDTHYNNIDYNLETLLWNRRSIGSIVSNRMMYKPRRFFELRSGDHLWFDPELKFCQDCVEEQYNKYKFYYWRREYQDRIITICPYHKKPLKRSGIKINPYHRKERYLPSLSEEIIEKGKEIEITEHSLDLVDAEMDLLSMRSFKIPTKRKWYHYYKNRIINSLYYYSLNDLEMIINNKLKEMNLIINKENMSILKKIAFMSRSSDWFIHYILHTTIFSSKKISQVIDEITK